MKEILISLFIFGVVALSLINLKPQEVVKEIREVPKVVIKERVVVKEIVKEPWVIYKTVNHYNHYHRYRTVVAYYPLPEQPRVQRVSYNYYEPVKEQPEYEKEPTAVALAPKAVKRSEVKMFFIEGIRQPLWVKGGENE